MKKYLIFTLTLVLVLSTSCKQKRNTQVPAENLVPVKTDTVDYCYFREKVHAAGKLGSREEMKLSFKTGGIVSAIPVREGVFVKKGTVLAKLNLAEIQAGARQAGLAQDKAYRDLVRVRNLYRDSVATLEQYQNTRTAYELAKAQKQIADFNLKYSVITAPGDGKVLKILTEVNEMIAPGYPALLFASSSEEWVLKVALTDRDIVGVAENDSARVWMDAYPDTIFSALVTDLGVIADPYTGTYEAEILLEGTIPGFRSGLIASADIYASAKDSLLWVPLTSLVDPVDNIAYVYLVNGRKALKKRILTYHIWEDGILVKDGLEQGDVIVVEGAALLGPESRIKTVN